MAATPPVSTPAVVCVVQANDVLGRVSSAEAQHALESLSIALPKTKFDSAWPAALPGLIAIRLSDGSVGYTDKSGRYLILGLVLDTATGGALDQQLDGKP